VTIYSPHTLSDEGDAARAMNATVVWRKDTARLVRVVSDIDFNRSVVGKTFRKQAQAFMDAVRALPPEQLENPPGSICIGGSDVEIPQNAFAPKYSYMEEGEKVDVLTIGDIIVTIGKD
jgi:valyl-tRNA synthetase